MLNKTLLQSINLINEKYFMLIGYSTFSIYFFYSLSIYYKISIILISLAHIKLIYKISQLSLLDIICLKSNFNLDCDIIYLLYKNRNNKDKINILLKNTDYETKEILTNSIYNLIFKKNKIID